MAFRASYAGIRNPSCATRAEQRRCSAKFATEVRIPTELKRTHAKKDKCSRTGVRKYTRQTLPIEPWPSLTSSGLGHSRTKFRRHGSPYVRLVWSEVKAALNRGHSPKAVHQRLAEAGLDITYRRLSQCVSHLRREEKRFGLPPKVAGKASVGPDSSTASTRVGDDKISRIEAPEERGSAQSATADPLADFRERTAKNENIRVRARSLR
jgi:hypothetical protein